MFPAEVDLLAALAIGFFSSLHCIGMCGGIAAALAPGLPAADRRRWWQFHLAYNGGRVASYTLAGAAAGLLGSALAGGGGFATARLLLQAAAGLFLVLMGLYLAGWSPLLARLERAGGCLWRRVEPLGRRLLPLRSAGAAVPLGMLWGWLPCGLVYSALVWAVASGGPFAGGALMFAFGVGTLPSMLATGLLAARMRGLARGRARLVAGVLVIALGAAGLVSALGLAPGHGDRPGAGPAAMTGDHAH